MDKTPWRGSLDAAHQAALRWLESRDSRRIRPEVDFDKILSMIDGPVPNHGQDAVAVVSELVDTVEPGLIDMGSGKFFGWVIGGSQPAGIAAEWLVSTWDQNACMASVTPAMSAIEQVTARWILEMLEFPTNCGVGFVTGGQMANFVCLAAARGAVLRERDWDVEARGLTGAPSISVIGGQERHHTIDKALRLLGLGEQSLTSIGVDSQGRLNPEELRRVLDASDDPLIVCAQAGQINTGAVDDFEAITEVIETARSRRRRNDIWLHIDGAIGLWGRVSPKLKPQFRSCEKADSWSTDAHKWLNTPYDCGVAIVRDENAHRRAMSMRADYLPAPDENRSPLDWTPELSRRARATAVYATIRQLGQSGIVEMIERCCEMARLMAVELSAHDGVEVVNEVTLNQVLVRLRDQDDRCDPHTPAVLQKVQEQGECFPTGTMWNREPAIRISVCNWSTNEVDVRESVDAIVSTHNSIRTTDSAVLSEHVRISAVDESASQIFTEKAWDR